MNHYLIAHFLLQPTKCVEFKCSNGLFIYLFIYLFILLLLYISEQHILANFKLSNHQTRRNIRNTCLTIFIIIHERTARSSMRSQLFYYDKRCTRISILPNSIVMEFLICFTDFGSGGSMDMCDGANPCTAANEICVKLDPDMEATCKF